jgi:hypothetical protein
MATATAPGRPMKSLIESQNGLKPSVAAARIWSTTAAPTAADAPYFSGSLR